MDTEPTSSRSRLSPDHSATSPSALRRSPSTCSTAFLGSVIPSLIAPPPASSTCAEHASRWPSVAAARSSVFPSSSAVCMKIPLRWSRASSSDIETRQESISRRSSAAGNCSGASSGGSANFWKSPGASEGRANVLPPASMITRFSGSPPRASGSSVTAPSGSEPAASATGVIRTWIAVLRGIRFTRSCRRCASTVASPSSSTVPVNRSDS